MFQSRLNANIREEKGYSYGVSSNFAFGKGPGAFRAGGDIVGDKTDARARRVHEGAAGASSASRPITDEELNDREGRADPAAAGDVRVGQRRSTARSTSLWSAGPAGRLLPAVPKAIAAVTKEDVLRVAKKYIDLDHLAIVIVGDRASIEAPLKATNIAPIAYLDIEGAPKTQP